jgi:hypothetical protein
MSGLTGGLRNSTAELARLFQMRMDMLRDRSDIVKQLRPLQGADLPSLEEALPEPRVAVGIDGSMDYDEVLEMLLFYVAAGGYKCRFTIGQNRVQTNRGAVHFSCGATLGRRSTQCSASHLRTNRNRH